MQADIERYLAGQAGRGPARRRGARDRVRADGHADPDDLAPSAEEDDEPEQRKRRWPLVLLISCSWR